MRAKKHLAAWASRVVREQKLQRASLRIHRAMRSPWRKLIKRIFKLTIPLKGCCSATTGSLLLFSLFDRSAFFLQHSPKWLERARENDTQKQKLSKQVLLLLDVVLHQFYLLLVFVVCREAFFRMGAFAASASCVPALKLTRFPAGR